MMNYLSFVVGPLLHHGGWVVVAYSFLVSAQGPLVLGFGLKGLGLRVWGQVLTIVTRACIVSCYDLIGLRNRLYHDGAERGEGRTL